VNATTIDDTNLKGAFAEFITQPETVKRIKRWLWYPHSAEKWFQFEFLYTLDRHCTHGLHVAAERRDAEGRFPDLGIYDIATTGESLARVSAVAVTLAKSEFPTEIDLALSRYGGSSSSKIRVGGPLSSFVHAVRPGAFRGE